MCLLRLHPFWGRGLFWWVLQWTWTSAENWCRVQVLQHKSDICQFTSRKFIWSTEFNPSVKLGPVRWPLSLQAVMFDLNSWWIAVNQYCRLKVRFTLKQTTDADSSVYSAVSVCVHSVITQFCTEPHGQITNDIYITWTFVVLWILKVVIKSLCGVLNVSVYIQRSSLKLGMNLWALTNMLNVFFIQLNF